MKTPRTKFPLTLQANAFALGQLLILDQTLTGTRNYMGFAYFWHYAYRHALRACSQAKRLKVHDAFLAAGLPVDGESTEHTAIIRKFIPNW